MSEYKSQEYLDAMEDVHTRFILNLPESELAPERILFQIEQAWWYYEDFICDPIPDCTLPRFSALKPFASQMYQFSPLLNASDFHAQWNKHMLYKKKISNYGCILMSGDCRQMVLCQVWNGKSFTMPAGKINQGETGMDAAARETYEETGFDPQAQYGLAAEWQAKSPEKITWTPLHEENALTIDDNGKQRTCYVVPNVPLDFPFAPVCRKEVSEIHWFDIGDLPKNSFAVMPFMAPLRRWIKKYCKKNGIAVPKRESSRGRNSRGRSSRGRDSRGRVSQGDNDLVSSGLAGIGDASGWSEEAMFAANERLIGRKIEYDGNPHLFEQGFVGGQDPHAFHVVGGGFMNASAVEEVAPPPPSSKLQPLFRADTPSSDVTGLQPFFGNDGSTPWGDVVEGAKGSSKKQKNRNKTKGSKSSGPVLQILQHDAQSSEDFDDFTDRAIIAKSQVTKLRMEDKVLEQYEEDMAYIRQWVANLPKPPVTKHFGEFRLDAEKIVEVAMRGIP